MGSLYIGTAGWSIPSACASHFPAEGSHLERYAQVFNAVEINSSFYRAHLPATLRAGCVQDLPQHVQCAAPAVRDSRAD